MSNESAICVRGLRKTYGATAAVDGIDLDISRGEVFALLGPNGAGKTTTVEILEGYRHRDGGTVAVLGEDPATRGPGLAGQDRDRPAADLGARAHRGGDGQPCSPASTRGPRSALR